MRTILLLLIVTLCFTSCEEETILTPNTQVADEALTTCGAMPEISFSDALAQLEGDSNIRVVLEEEDFPGRPYVICIMQRHEVTENSKIASGATPEHLDLISRAQEELSAAYTNTLSLFDLPVYAESINQELGAYAYPGIYDYANQKILSSLLLSAVVENGSTIYGIETRESRGVGILNKMLSEHRSLYLKSMNYDDLPNEQRVPIVVDYIIRLEADLQDYRLEVSNSYFVSESANSVEVQNILEALNMYGSPSTCTQDQNIDTYVKYVKYLSDQKQEVILNLRNLQAVSVLPRTENSILILGGAHFCEWKGEAVKKTKFTTDILLICIEDLLEDQELNYILVQAKSTYSL